jgi:Pyridoxamine 5'-phosphate oxidase
LGTWLVSIAVSLDELRAQMEEFSTDAYLLTVRDDGRAHSVAVPVRWVGDTLVVPAGATTAANAAARPLVALLWPPPERGGYSLIVDADVVATAEVDGGHEVTLRPTRGVLHRPAPSGTGNDCSPLL